MSRPISPNTTSSHSSFVGQEFSNNLLSDLAPLLTLFGEQVTKQFLSMSMGWADNILLSLGPLGIMTILVSTIRVSGVKRLKTIVGRARESKATAEAELLSSTSHEVCEMWDDQQVVRTFGSPKTLQIVITHEKSGLIARNLKDAYLDGYLVDTRGRKLSSDELEELGEAPNLTLNAPGSTVSNVELWAWVLVGTVAQLSAVVFPGVMQYRWGWRVASYGYPCYLLGTVTLIAGLTLCSRTIEGSTTELNFVPNPERSPNANYHAPTTNVCGRATL